MQNNKIVKQAMIAALYIVLSLITIPLNATFLSIRLSEMLIILPIFGIEYIYGISIGCMITNFFIAGNIFDIVFGTLATVIGGIGTFYFRKNFNIAIIPPILINAIIVSFIFKYIYGMNYLYIFIFIQLLISEFLAIGILGKILLKTIQKHNIITIKDK